MVAGANLVYYGPYQLPQRAITALEAYGLEDPDDLDDFKMMELRSIPGFGEIACRAVREYRDFKKFQDRNPDSILDLSVPEVEKEPEPPKQINICLVVSDEGLFRLRHYEWVQNMLRNFTDPSSGNPLQTESDLIAYFIRTFYAADPSKGGTRGVETGGATVDPHTGQPTQEMDYRPKVTLT